MSDNRTCKQYRSVTKDSGYSLKVVMTKQLRELGLGDKDQVLVYVQDGKIIIER